MLLKPAGKALALITLLAVTGCSSTGGMNGTAGNLFTATADNPIRIESEPSGAAVYVMDKMIGLTPLNISNKDVFPTLYPKEKESLYGKVTLKQTGCSDFTRTIDSKIINSGLHAQLDCGGVKPASSQASSEAHSITETVEQRLGKIKDLLDKGLITEEEAKKARERVLNDL
ncbi:MAG: PEGA domain-containing protein [Gallionellaceae bacterium]